MLKQTNTNHKNLPITIFQVNLPHIKQKIYMYALEAHIHLNMSSKEDWRKHMWTCICWLTHTAAKKKKHVKNEEIQSRKERHDVKDCYDWTPDPSKAIDKIWTTVMHVFNKLIQEKITFLFSLAKFFSEKGSQCLCMNRGFRYNISYMQTAASYTSETLLKAQLTMLVKYKLQV